MTLAERLNEITDEQNISKANFAQKLGLTKNYVCLLTSDLKRRPDSILPALAKLMALEFGYDGDWILHETDTEAAATKKAKLNIRTVTGPLRGYGITERQKEIIDLLCTGKLQNDIADELSVSKNTVMYHVNQIYRRTGLHSRTELVDFMNKINDTAEEE